MNSLLTPTEVARLFRVRDEKVYGWIANGILRVINVSTSTIPRYRVTQEAIEGLKQYLEFHVSDPQVDNKPRRKADPISPKRAKILARLQSKQQ